MKAQPISRLPRPRIRAAREFAPGTAAIRSTLVVPPSAEARQQQPSWPPSFPAVRSPPTMDGNLQQPIQHERFWNGRQRGDRLEEVVMNVDEAGHIDAAGEIQLLSNAPSGGRHSFSLAIRSIVLSDSPRIVENCGVVITECISRQHGQMKAAFALLARFCCVQNPTVDQLLHPVPVGFTIAFMCLFTSSQQVLVVLRAGIRSRRRGDPRWLRSIRRP